MLEDLKRPAVAGLLFVLGACCLSILWSTARVVAPAEVEQLEAAIRQAATPQDLVVIAPSYERQVTPSLVDLTLNLGRDLSRFDARRASGIYVVELDLNGASRLVEQVSDFASGPFETVTSIGPHKILKIKREPLRRVSFDLFYDLAETEIWVKYPNRAPQRCTARIGSRLACPEHADWNYVEPQTVFAGGQARRCVWMHPVQPGGWLEFRIADTRVGTADRIHLELGFTLTGADRAGAPVDASLWQDGAQIGTMTHPKGHSLSSTEAELTPNSALRLRLTTKNNGGSHLCGRLQLTQARQ